MSTYMRGRLVTENGQALVGYHVALKGPVSLFGSDELSSAEVQHDGFFEFVNYPKDGAPLGSHRTLELVAEDRVGRTLPFAGSSPQSSRFAVQESHLFSLGPEFAADLDLRQLTPALQKKFSENDQPLNLQEAELVVDEVHAHWTITCRSRIYKIHKSDQNLDVYRVTGRMLFQDVSDEQITGHEFVIREADAKGFLVTLDTGMVRGFSADNGVTLLIDQEAFTYGATLLGTAREYVLFSQLYFDLPLIFNPDATKETPSLIFDFHQPAPDADHLRALVAGDARPERLLIDAADRGATVRILLHSYKIPLIVKILVGALVFPFAGTDGIFAANETLSNLVSEPDSVKRYFGAAGRSNIKVQTFPQPLLSGGVMHAKLMVVDGRRVVSFGSPFGQSYIDTHDHRIDAPVRGDEEGFPKHDAGFALDGPAMADLYNTLELLWNTAAPDDRIQSWPPDRPPNVHGPEAPLPEPESTCAVQIVRTLSVKTFQDPPDGEKGILEAYLRAIANAKEFIYLENQYFTNDRIGDALVKAMVNNSELQVIVVLNIRPDMPFYPFKQRRLIHRIREGIGQTPAGPQQFGVYTRWTHETGQPRPRILPIYVHAKLGIVDNTWATVGSANLDGLSLDSFLIGDKINAFFRAFDIQQLVRDERAIEVNAVMLNNEEHSSDVVDLLRRKLWAEHLGYTLPSGAPDINAADLKTPPPGGWLALWMERAEATLKQLINKPALPLTGMARVLPWPTDNSTHKTPRDHLTALGIHSYALVPLRSTRAFDFKTGTWKTGSKAEMDYD